MCNPSMLLDFKHTEVSIMDKILLKRDFITGDAIF